MRTNMKRSIAAAGLALALPFGLAACGGDDKPSKDEVKEGMTTILEDYGINAETMEAAGISAEQLDNYYTCIIDEIYDEVDAESLKSVADGQDQILAEDQAALNSAVSSCQGELGM